MTHDASTRLQKLNSSAGEDAKECSAEPVRAEAQAILKAIRAATPRNGGADARKNPRLHCCVPMTLHVDDPKRAETRVIRAASSNVSGGGFAFIFDMPVTTGSTVRAQFESLPGKPEITGVVRSCVYICGTQHRIGVEYL